MEEGGIIHLRGNPLSDFAITNEIPILTGTYGVTVEH